MFSSEWGKKLKEKIKAKKESEGKGDKKKGKAGLFGKKDKKKGKGRG